MIRNTKLGAFLLFVSMIIGLHTSASATDQAKRERQQFVTEQLGDQWSISHSICSTWENIMVNQTVPFRQQGYPVSTAESTYDSEDDIGTRLLLKRFVRRIYQDPAEGKELLDNGIFFVMCVREHRGF